MPSSILKLSRLETIELTTDPEFAVTGFQKLTPIKAGTAIPALGGLDNTVSGHPFFNEIALNTDVDSFTYSRKPLLLYFYEQEWGALSLGHLQQLQAIQSQLRNHNINLLVITAGSITKFQQLSWEKKWSIEVVEDSNNHMATLLRIYSEESPAWGSYSGINNNISLPALYLLDSRYRVAFDYANQHLHANLPLAAVIPATAGTAQFGQARRSA
jgi:peroxiredoxin